jgi:hypothetical protein
MREQKSGTLIGFTSGAFAGSVAQVYYASAKGGIVCLVRSAAAGMHRYGVTANCVAPVARTRMSANVPMEIGGIGDAEDVAPMVVFLLGAQARHITGQVYTLSGGKIAVWNQPVEARAMFKDGRWPPEEIADRLPGSIGVERMAASTASNKCARAAAKGGESERVAAQPAAPEWSHLDSNQGPPACEGPQGEIREHPLSPYVVDFTKKSRLR